MKKLALLFGFILALSFINAQTGIIYDIKFRIDPELITESKIQNQDHQILNISTVEEMPKSLSDTIISMSEKIIGRGLKTTFTSLIPEEKFIMAAIPEHLMYMPSNSYKKARKAGEYDYYIKIYCNIQAFGGVAVTLGENTYSKVKPKMTLNITGYDKNKKRIHRGRMVFTDFDKLRSRTYKTDLVVNGWFETTNEITESETLTSDDILRMYLWGLETAY